MSDLLNEKDLENVAGGMFGDVTGKTYTVQAGDTLHKIAEKFGTSTAALALLNADVIIKTAQANGIKKANPVEYADYVFEGEVLRLP